MSMQQDLARCLNQSFEIDPSADAKLGAGSDCDQLATAFSITIPHCVWSFEHLPQRPIAYPRGVSDLLDLVSCRARTKRLLAAVRA